MSGLPDPRTFPDADAATAGAARIHALARASLGAHAQGEAHALDAEIDEEFGRLVAAGAGDALAEVLDMAPSVTIHRHLRRALARCLAAPIGVQGGLGVALFAIPIVLVTARAGSQAPARLPGVLHDAARLAATLREHGAIGGSQAFSLANALVGTAGIDVRALPDIVAASRLGAADAFAPVVLPKAPVDLPEGEAAQLRFVVGGALAGQGFELGRDGASTAWMRPFAHALGGQLTVPGASVLAIPRAAQCLPAALMSGRAAQRDVSAQLFASNALRQLRASVGEPIAVIGAHRAADAPGGGELRLSLSSPLDPREALGFCCPLYPWERVVDVAAMLIDLLRDCRVADVRTLAGLHADRDPLTGGRLLFKPETIPPAVDVTIH